MSSSPFSEGFFLARGHCHSVSSKIASVPPKSYVIPSLPLGKKWIHRVGHILWLLHATTIDSRFVRIHFRLRNVLWRGLTAETEVTLNMRGAAGHDASTEVTTLFRHSTSSGGSWSGDSTAIVAQRPASRKGYSEVSEEPAWWSSAVSYPGSRCLARVCRRVAMDNKSPPERRWCAHRSADVHHEQHSRVVLRERNARQPYSIARRKGQ